VVNRSSAYPSSALGTTWATPPARPAHSEAAFLHPVRAGCRPGAGAPVEPDW